MAAVPWLPSAETVDVIIGVRHGKPIAALSPILTERAVAARLHSIPATTRLCAHQLLTKIRELDCDMIVMGAYGHSALRGLLLGSFTDSVIAEADRPVLLCH